ncbi:MAG TPA: patatin-like phospholipase family protein, partial [Pyrinomonadaceae bacterium]|nr:patatin-like phospholipase family protein [Pyrinomonadaceae bacterium]
MSKSSEIPLHVYQVLEEEYVSLHGSLEEDDVLALPHEAREDKRRGAGDGRRRKVRARRDWFFHRGHVKNPVGFVLRLRPSLAGESEAAPRRAARQPDDISKHLSKWIPEDVARDVYEFVGPFSGDVNRLFDDAEGDAQDAEGARARRALDRLEESLNRLLADESFYDERAFLNVRLGEATSAFVENVAPSGARGESYRDDLAHFNRLLLEDAFPEELERVHNVRLAAVQRRFHLKRQAALCLSGGGIRSGTFALGLIQGLARHNLLGHFQYLSTVSGGGYIGGWLSAWMRRHRDGLGGVTEELRKTPPDSKIDPEPEPIRYLRQYSNFITPKVGLMSADTWAFVAIYLRNLLLNWVVLIPLALGVLALPRLYVSAILAPLGWEWTNPAAAVQETRATQIVQTTQAAPPVEARRLMSLLPSAFESRHVLLLIGFVLAVCAVAYVVLNRPFLREQLKQRSPFWYKRTGQSSFILCCLAPLVLGAICLTVYWAWSLYAWRTHESLVDQDKPVLSYVAFGAAMNLFGWLLASLILRRFTPSYWRELKRGELVTLLWELAALVAVGGGGAYLFKLAEDASSPVVAYVGTHWTTWTTELYACLAVPGFLVAFLLAMTLFIGLTSHFSLFTDEDREWWARAGAWLLITIIAWVTFSGLVIFGPLALLASPTLLGSVGGASGLAALLAGRSSKTGANDEHAAEGGLLSSLMGVLLPVLAAVFIAVF